MTGPRVAAFTPGPPLRSGGAVYAGALLPALAEHFDVVAVCPVRIDWDGPTVAPSDVDPARHDLLIHFLGDNPDHLFAYRSALDLGGVVVCHELSLPHLLGAFAPQDEAADLEEQLGQEEARKVLSRRERGLATHQEAYLRQVISRPVRRATAAVVHSRFAKLALEAEVPSLPVHQVPSHTGAVPWGVERARSSVRASHALSEDSFLVGMFGYLGGHKRVLQALRGLAQAVPEAKRKGVDIRVLVIGSSIALDLREAVVNEGLDDVTLVLGALDDQSFFEHMASVDAVVSLRYPTLGETSATMLQAMHLGKPVVTSDHGQFADERAAVRIAPDIHEARGVADALVALATCQECRERVSAASSARAESFTLQASVDAYLRVIDSVLGRRLPRFGSVRGCCGEPTSS